MIVSRLSPSALYASDAASIPTVAKKLLPVKPDAKAIKISPTRFRKSLIGCVLLATSSIQAIIPSRQALPLLYACSYAAPYTSNSSLLIGLPRIASINAAIENLAAFTFVINLPASPLIPAKDSLIEPVAASIFSLTPSTSSARSCRASSVSSMSSLSGSLSDKSSLSLPPP